MKVRLRIAAALSLLALGALPLAGCGTGGLEPTAAGDASQGQQLFTAHCAGCHTLAAAGSRSEIGPSLDAAFYRDRQDKIDESTIRSVVADQIRFPTLPMPPPSVTLPTCKKPNRPANCVTDRDAAIASIAKFVGTSAGVNGAEAPPPSAAGNDPKRIFSTNCGSCHTLAAAGTHGTIGPNLDQLKPAFARAKAQIEHGGGVMPAFQGKLTPQQIDAVAKFIASHAGK